MSVDRVKKNVSKAVHGLFGLGLCPTHDRLDDIGFSMRRPAADCKNPRVKSDRTRLVGGQVG